MLRIECYLATTMLTDYRIGSVDAVWSTLLEEELYPYPDGPSSFHSAVKRPRKLSVGMRLICDPWGYPRDDFYSNKVSDDSFQPN